MTVANILDSGRKSFERQAWGDAFAELSAADRETVLELDDLERLAEAAYLVGRDDESDHAWARAHHECLRLGFMVRAARCAGSLARGLLLRGEMALGGGWLARAQRLLDEEQHNGVERGYLLLPVALQSFEEDPAAARERPQCGASTCGTADRPQQLQGPARRAVDRKSRNGANRTSPRRIGKEN